MAFCPHRLKACSTDFHQSLEIAITLVSSKSAIYSLHLFYAQPIVPNGYLFCAQIVKHQVILNPILAVARLRQSPLPSLWPILAADLP
ncbi:MAG: hypothetical protein ACRC8A_19235 [Microcoleaceae cyanobacterium]